AKLASAFGEQIALNVLPALKAPAHLTAGERAITACCEVARPVARQKRASHRGVCFAQPRRRCPMRITGTRVLAMALMATAAAGAVACRRPAATTAPPPPEVYVAAVVQKDVPEYLELVGQTDGYQDVDIRARVEG